VGVRRAIVILALAAPAALLGTAVAGAGGGRHAGPPPPGAPAPGPVAVQAGDTKKVRLAATQTTSLRGKRLRADDAAAPPSPGTAPAMSASSPLAVAPGGAHSIEISVAGARAPPAGASSAARV
jgi:hypothetical protein